MKLPELRKYQEEAKRKIKKEGVTVLAMAPNGGKTTVAVSFILDNPQFKRVLIITHSTNVLKEQWTDVLDKYEVSYSLDVMSKDGIVIALPTLWDKSQAFGHYDLLILDEAHENLADVKGKLKRMPEIIKEASPTCQLLLTGTPAKLIEEDQKMNKGYHFVFCAADKISKDGLDGSPKKHYFCNTYFGLAVSNYSLRKTDYTADGDRKETSHDTIPQVKNAIKVITAEMISRLSQNGLLKDKPNVLNGVTRITKKMIKTAFTEIGKTLIAAHNCRQAYLIDAELKSMGINSVVSVSKDDGEA